MLTKKAQYAFRALTVLAKRQAQHDHDTVWTSARDIVQASPMSLKFLEQILVDLKAGGIIKSRRGPSGGHALSAPAADIVLARVIRLMDGPIAPLSCVSLHFYERCEDCIEEDCGLHRMMVEVRDAQLSVLESRSLQDLIKS